METKELPEDQLNQSTERKEKVPGDWAGGSIGALAMLRKLEFVTQIFLSQTLLSVSWALVWLLWDSTLKILRSFIV